MAAINEIPVEDYLKSVISSEMNPKGPLEFLKAHAILSRSWVLNALDRRRKGGSRRGKASADPAVKNAEVVRWYDREDHDLFDVCADDHCQRYQGVSRITSPPAESAVERTRGSVMAYGGEICDARYSKACGGLTEDFATAWEGRRIPYLQSISDAPDSFESVETEEQSARWILAAPPAYCNTRDESLLERILPDFDRETKGFFRWTVEYPREELEDILRRKSGIDFGTLREIVPLSRGPSGRIFRLSISGSRATAVVGKELEIRRWLSPTHLYSSAFVVNAKYGSQGAVERFLFHGAGWGHGVGLCQIGAAVMAEKGFSAEDILKHYFRGMEIKEIY